MAGAAPSEPRQGELHLLFVAPVAFSYHFVWETLQCQIFFVHLQLPPTWGAMVVATAGDVVMTYLAYFVIAVATKDTLWYVRRPWRRSSVVLLELIALVLAVAVEHMGLSMGRWTYVAGTPMLTPFGVSLVPVLQLMLLLPATFVSAAYVAWRRRSSGGAH